MSLRHKPENQQSTDVGFPYWPNCPYAAQLSHCGLILVASHSRPLISSRSALVGSHGGVICGSPADDPVVSRRGVLALSHRGLVPAAERFWLVVFPWRATAKSHCGEIRQLPAATRRHPPPAITPA